MHRPRSSGCFASPETARAALVGLEGAGFDADHIVLHVDATSVPTKDGLNAGRPRGDDATSRRTAGMAAGLGAIVGVAVGVVGGIIAGDVATGATIGTAAAVGGGIIGGSRAPMSGYP